MCRRGTLGRPWVAAVFTIVIVIAVVSAFFIADAVKQKHSSCDVDLCLTAACVHAASQVLTSLDRSADPCESFNSFACGEFIRTTTIPDDAFSVNHDDSLRSKVIEQLRVILKEPISDKDRIPVRLAKDLYAACLNTSLIEERGLTPIQNILKELGGWPVLEGDSWNEVEFDWKKTIYKLRRLGLHFDYIIEMEVADNSRNHTWSILTLNKGSLRVPTFSSRLFDYRVKAYYKYMRKVAVILGANPEETRKELLKALNFELALVEIPFDPDDHRNSNLSDGVMSVSDLQSNFPSVPWLEYINNLMPEEVGVNENYVVDVADVKFLTLVEDLLACTNKRTVANYLLWRVLDSIVEASPTSIAVAQLKFKKVILGELTAPPRWKICSQRVYDELPVAVSSMYVKNFFPNEWKEILLEMVKDIQNAFRKTVENVDWMDKNTKKRILDKDKNTTVHIGYSDELLDDAKVDEYYRNLRIDKERFLESKMNVSKFNTDVSFSTLYKAYIRLDWRQINTAADVNAYAHTYRNSIVLPAGILQGSFSPNRPMYMNYGAVGYIIGHELTHIFDEKLDEDGNQVEWWEPETLANYREEVRCIIDQYENLTEPMTGLKLDGYMTQDENIADNGGLKQSYLAYLQWHRRQLKPEPRLPGLEWLSPQQMFWVSYAQLHCSKTHPEELRINIELDVHTPHEFRTDPVVSNAEQFSTDFNCPLGSRMNPKHKCNLW